MSLAHLTADPDFKPKVIWEPIPGSQTRFLTCPVQEVLLEGTRGGGKTDALLMKFAQYVGQGYGSEWRGIIFRKTHPELEDIINKSRKWFSQIFPDAKFNISKSTWVFKTGEVLIFSHFERPSDYYSYHGHAYPFIGWEELTTHPTDEGYLKMMSCCRSTYPGIPKVYASTTNPDGVGHSWVKKRFRLPSMRNRVIKDDYDPSGNLLPPRVAIYSSIYENKHLMDNDPTYISSLRASADSEAQLKAWLDGDWDIVAGGMFDDVWSDVVIPRIPTHKIPASWRIDRSFDWGSSKPFSVGWWAETSGEDIPGYPKSFPSGTLIRIADYYGCHPKEANKGTHLDPSDIAEEIKRREEKMGIAGRVKPGPADGSIYDKVGRQASIAELMIAKGVKWVRADKSPGSRINGWAIMRQRMKQKSLLISEACEHTIRTIPVLPRDKDKPDDVDTDAEDHIADEMRYRVLHKKKTSYSASW